MEFARAVIGFSRQSPNANKLFSRTSSIITAKKTFLPADFDCLAYFCILLQKKGFVYVLCLLLFPCGAAIEIYILEGGGVGIGRR